MATQCVTNIGTIPPDHDISDLLDIARSNGVSTVTLPQDPERVDSEEGDTLEQRETLTDDLETVKISNLVEPIRFETGVANIPDETVESLGDILERMRHRMNMRLHLIGHGGEGTDGRRRLLRGVHRLSRLGASPGSVNAKSQNRG